MTTYHAPLSPQRGLPDDERSALAPRPDWSAALDEAEARCLSLLDRAAVIAERIVEVPP